MKLRASGRMSPDLTGDGDEGEDEDEDDNNINRINTGQIGNFYRAKW